MGCDCCSSVVLTFASPLMAQTGARLPHAKKPLEQTVLIDGHNDLAWEIRAVKGAPRDVAAYDLRTPRKGMTDLARLKAGRSARSSGRIYIPGEIKDSGYARVQLEQIDIARRIIARYPEACTGPHRRRHRSGIRSGADRLAARAWRAATRSRIRSARFGPTTTWAPGT